jgi:hypothetical protein
MKEQRKIDLLEEVAEEITLSMGLRANVVNNKIEVDTIAGVIAFEALFPTVMENFYRFVYLYGSRLHKYGIKQRIKYQKTHKGMTRETVIEQAAQLDISAVSTNIIYNDSDEWFVGNLVALATSELALVRKGKNEKVDRKMLISWIVEHL